MSTPPAQLPHSTIAPSQNYQSSLYQLPNQVPQMAQAAPSTQTPADPLEQRVLDLLYPYRDECFMEEDRTTVAQERMALILSGTSSPRPLQLLSPSTFPQVFEYATDVS